MIDLLRDGATVILLLGAAFFFAAGTIGLLRFPDLYCRLHALTKADNVGLGLTALALLLQSDGPMQALKLILVWVLAATASATIANLFAKLGRRHGIPEWRKDGAPRRSPP